MKKYLASYSVQWSNKNDYFVRDKKINKIQVSKNIIILVILTGLEHITMLQLAVVYVFMSEMKMSMVLIIMTMWMVS